MRGPEREREAGVVQWFDHRLGQVVTWVDHLEEALTSILLVAILVINGMEIFTRAVLASSLFWVYEVNLLLANWIYFLGICLVYYRGRDITVEFLFNRLSARTRRLYAIALNAVMIAIVAVIIFYGYRLLLVQSRTTTLGVKIPNHLFSLPVVLGAASMILIFVKQSLTLWLEGEPREPEFREAGP
jgi:TRAP-type C4-dicarboxylate transport system permease small subunit